MPSCKFCRSNEDLQPNTAWGIYECTPCGKKEHCVGCDYVVKDSFEGLCKRCRAPVMERVTTQEQLQSAKMSALEFMVALFELEEEMIRKLNDVPIQLESQTSLRKWSNCSENDNVFGCTIISEIENTEEYMWQSLHSIDAVARRILMLHGSPRCLFIAFLCHEYVHCLVVLMGKNLEVPGHAAFEDECILNEEGLCHMVFAEWLITDSILLEAEEAELSKQSRNPVKLWARRICDFWVKKLLVSDRPMFGQTYKRMLDILGRGLNQGDVKVSTEEWNVLLTVVRNRLDPSKF